MEVKTIIAAAAVLGLTGCGGGSTVGNSPPNGDATPGGIWHGNESVSGLQITGLVDESGDFHFLRGDGVQYAGAATVNGTSLSANVEGIVPLGFTFPDGSNHGTGTISATITARKSLSASTQFKTDFGNTSNGTLNLTFDTLYNRESSLTTLSGNFTNASNSAVVTISTNGSLFSQDATSGCVLNGSATILNSKYNAYKVQFDYANCVGAASALNGVQFTGLAMLDNTVVPERFTMGVTGQSGNIKYALTLQLNRT